MHDIAQKQIFFFLTTRAGSGSGFGGELSGSDWIRIRIRNTGDRLDPVRDPQNCSQPHYFTRF